MSDEPRPQAFRGMTLAWNCSTPDEVDRGHGACAVRRRALLKQPQKTFYGGYSGYFTDPDGTSWEVVCAPGFDVQADGRVTLPD